ncbi:hypothetical protein [Niallia circulans]|uniref:hypothetical protein n=1 Tax=Niallia circulans TaxID=1397 RepID=UPI00201DCF32|nr:hypothetical protein [Niallia circulans]
MLSKHSSIQRNLALDHPRPKQVIKKFMQKEKRGMRWTTLWGLKKLSMQAMLNP